MDGQREFFPRVPWAMGLWPFSPDEVERPCNDAGMGPAANAASDAGARLGYIRMRPAPWRQLGRTSLPKRVREYACLSRVWPSGSHRHGRDTVCVADAVELC